MASWASELGSVAMNLKMLRLLVVLLASFGRGESTFVLTFGGRTSHFKGLPELVPLNKSAGEARLVLYHEQTVGVVDVVQRNILRCEFVEVYEPSESDEILINLSRDYQPQWISLKDMVELMDKCDKLDEQSLVFSHSNGKKSRNGHTLVDGIYQGTKWCGIGDIAKSYHDLGPETKVDRCCRNHDLCPVKIRPFKRRYGLENLSSFSKSHCMCDDVFFQCLKSINTDVANFIGRTYFDFYVFKPRTCIGEIQLTDGRIVRESFKLGRIF